ncbi:MAG: aminopeptidase [Anaerolineales bacterium]|nr:aminopeptidase [Anaerolineales bacterium]
MADPRISKLAKILVNYSIKVREGDTVFIQGNPFSFEALPLFREVFREVLRAGGHPHVTLMREESLDFIFFSEASDAQLSHVDPIADFRVRNFDCHIYIKGSSNTRYLSGIDPNRQSTHQKANFELFKVLMERTASKDIRWVLSLFPTSGLAQDANMSVEEFENFVFSSTFADSEDPVMEWQKFYEVQQRLVDYLKKKSHLTVKGPDIDLSLSIEGRSFLNAGGTLNIPDGEIYTSPVEDTANGWVRFSFPAVLEGREVEGVELHFEKGKVMKATAEKNEEYLHAMLGTDEGASYIGEFAFGTNWNIKRFLKNILFDEKIGGTVHLALGYGFPEIGGKNESAIHWDMICDMRDGGQAFADGELFYESGEFMI